MLYITPAPPPPPLFPRSPAIRNKEKARHLVFFLFVSLAQTTPAQPAGGTSPSVGLLVIQQSSCVFDEVAFVPFVARRAQRE